MDVIQISYIGMGGSDNVLVKPLEHPTMTFSEVSPAISAVAVPELGNSRLVIIGPYTTDPLVQAGRFAKANPLISIIVLSFHEAFQKLKLETLFSRNASKNLQIVSYDFGKDLKEVITAAAVKTAQRQSFEKVLHSPLLSFSKQKARVSSTELEFLLETAPFILMIFDQAGNLVNYNRQSDLLFSLSDQCLGKSWNIIFKDTVDIFAVPSPIERLPLRIAERHFEASVSKIILSEKEPLKMVMLYDISEKIQATAKLADKLEELEFLNQELDEFVNVISHDFKTPLTAIIGLTGLIKRTELTQRQLELVERTERSADQIQKLLEGMTALVSIKENKDNKAQMVSFMDCLDTVLELLGSEIEESNATIHRDFQVSSVSYYPAHISSLMSNLVTNAIKYRKENVPLQLSITTYPLAELIILEVKDNGIGIDLTRDRSKLFQPFQRLSHLSTGTGLGLSIIKKALERNRGHIEVTSTVGKGTTFKVYIRPIFSKGFNN